MSDHVPSDWNTDHRAMLLSLEAEIRRWSLGWKARAVSPFL